MFRDSYIKYLDACNRFFLLTPRQINRLLLKGGGYSTLTPLLARLAEERYLARVDLGRYSSGGRAPIAYQIGPEGRKVLKHLGHDVPTRYRARTVKGKEETVPMHRPHTLAVNDFLIAASTIQHPAISLRTFQHEKVLNRQKIKVTLPSGKTIGVAPDAVVEFRLSDSKGRARVVLIHEEDMGTEHKGAWTEKVLAHLELMKGAYQERFSVTRFPLSIHTTAGEERMEELMTWTEEILLKQHVERPQRMAFHFSCYPATTANPLTLFTAPVWYRAFRERPVPIVQVALDAPAEEPATDRMMVLPPRVIPQETLSSLRQVEENERRADYLLNLKD